MATKETERSDKFSWGESDLVFEPAKDAKAVKGYASVRLPGKAAEAVIKAAKSIDPAHLTEKGVEVVPHITLAYDCLDDHKEGFSQHAAKTPPIQFTLGKMFTFPAGDKGVPLVAKVYSSQIGNLHEKLHSGVEGLKWNHDEYVPHVTLAYLKPEVADAYLRDKTFATSLVGETGLAESIHFSSPSGEVSTIPFASPALMSVLQGGLGDEVEDWTDFGIPDADLAEGIKVEMEHTDDPKVAKEIAIDHLIEDPDYYRKLSSAGLAQGFASDGNYHGNNPPEGWVQVGTGPRGGKVWAPPKGGDTKTEPAAAPKDAVQSVQAAGKEWNSKLMSSEKIALKAYESRMFQNINGGLRSGDFKKHGGDDVKRTADTVAGALDKASLPEPVTVHRVIVAKGDERDGILKTYQDSVGKNITDKAFVSASANKQFVDAIKKKQPHLLKVEIELPQGAKAAHVASATGTTGGVDGHEGHEVIIQRGQKFNVVSVDGDHVKLKLVN